MTEWASGRNPTYRIACPIRVNFRHTGCGEGDRRVQFRPDAAHVRRVAPGPPGGAGTAGGHSEGGRAAGRVNPFVTTIMANATRDAFDGRLHKMVADMLKIARTIEFVTQEALAASLRKPVTWVYECETGRRRVDFVELIAWLRACGRDVLPTIEVMVENIYQIAPGAPAKAKRRILRPSTDNDDI